MTAQKGKDLLLKVDDPGSGVFTTVAGLRTRRIALTNPAVDVTNADSPSRWQELLAGAGVRKCALSGSGIFLSAASDASLRNLFFNGVIAAWQIVIPGSGVISGPFLITSLDYVGDHAAELTFDIALESAGALSFAGG